MVYDFWDSILEGTLVSSLLCFLDNTLGEAKFHAAHTQAAPKANLMRDWFLQPPLPPTPHPWGLLAAAMRGSLEAVSSVIGRLQAPF